MRATAEVIIDAFYNSAICFSMARLRATGEECLVMCLGRPGDEQVTPVAFMLKPEVVEALFEGPDNLRPNPMSN